MLIKAIITAGGTSSRFGGNKLLEKLAGKEVIKHTVEKFLSIDDISEIVICSNISFIDTLYEIFKGEKKIIITQGGKNRQASVYNGLKALKECDYVLIHDAARPLISQDTIKECINQVKLKKAVSVVTKTTDTIKEVDVSGKIIKTIDRTNLYNTQTPQAFYYPLILKAHEKYVGCEFTDDASLIEACGEDVYIINNDNRNIKITTKSDIYIANAYLKDM